MVGNYSCVDGTLNVETLVENGVEVVKVKFQSSFLNEGSVYSALSSTCVLDRYGRGGSLSLPETGMTLTKNPDGLTIVPSAPTDLSESNMSYFSYYSGICHESNQLSAKRAKYDVASSPSGPHSLFSLESDDRNTYPDFSFSPQSFELQQQPQFQSQPQFQLSSRPQLQTQAETRRVVSIRPSDVVVSLVGQPNNTFTVQFYLRLASANPVNVEAILNVGRVTAESIQAQETTQFDWYRNQTSTCDTYSLFHPILLPIAQFQSSQLKMRFDQSWKLRDLFDARYTIEMHNLPQEFSNYVYDTIPSYFQPSIPSVQLYPHQVAGVNWLLKQRQMGTGGILADDMGLGKTLQSIYYILSMKYVSKAQNEDALPQPILIVVKSKLFETWKDELARVSKHADLRVIEVNSCTDFIKAGGMKSFSALPVDVILATQPVIQDCIGEFTKTQFDTIFIDEAQEMKNPNSKLAKNMDLLKIDAQTRFCLTATPLENNPTDLWTLMNFVDPRVLGTKRSFEAIYKTKDKKIDYKLFERLRSSVKPYLLRRTKEKSISGLPKKFTTVEYVPLNDVQQKMYDIVGDHYLKELAGDFSSEENGGRKKIGRKILTMSIHLAQVGDHPMILQSKMKDIVKDQYLKDRLGIPNFETTSSAKIQKLVQILKEKRVGDEGVRPALIFTRYTSVLKPVQAELRKQGILSTILSGKSSKAEIDKTLTEFNANQIPVLLLNLKAFGSGMNLQRADLVVILEPGWNPQLEKQAEDRIYRIGQDKDVQIIRLVTANSMESKLITRNQRRKQDLFNRVIDGVLQDNGEFESIWNDIAEGPLPISKSEKDESREEFDSPGSDSVLEPAVGEQFNSLRDIEEWLHPAAENS